MRGAREVALTAETSEALNYRNEAITTESRRAVSVPASMGSIRRVHAERIYVHGVCAEHSSFHRKSVQFAAKFDIAEAAAPPGSVNERECSDLLELGEKRKTQYKKRENKTTYDGKARSPFPRTIRYGSRGKTV